MARRIPYVIAIMSLVVAALAGLVGARTTPVTPAKTTETDAIAMSNRRQDIAEDKQWLRDINRMLDSDITDDDKQRLLESRERCVARITRMEEEAGETK